MLYQLAIVLIMVSCLHQTESWGAPYKFLGHLRWGHVWALKGGLLSQSQKQELIELFTSTLAKWVRTQEATDGTSPTSQSSRNQQPPSHTTTPSNHAKNGTVVSTLRLVNNTGDDGDGGADSPRVKRRKLTETSLKFACPFFKRDPTHYQSERTCVGPGWTTIHRVKYVMSHYMTIP